MADYGYLPYGEMHPGGVANLAYTSFTLDQSTDQLEFLFQARDAITITRLGYRANTITGTAPQFKLSLQGVTGAGIPDGTIKGGGSPASALFTPAAIQNWVWVTLDNPYVATRGEMLAGVIAYNAGTIDGSNSVTFSSTYNTHGNWAFPHSIHNNAGSRTNQGNEPVFGYGSASVAYGRPSKGLLSTAYGAASTPDERAIKFTIPSTIVASYKVAGIWMPWTSPLGGSTVKFILYDGTTVLQDVTYDTDFGNGPGAVTNVRFLFDEATLTTLTGGATYRLGIQPQDSTTIAVYRLEQNNASDFDAWPGGQNFAVSTRTDAGAWTDVPTERMFGGLILSEWSAGASGSHFIGG